MFAVEYIRVYSASYNASLGTDLSFPWLIPLRPPRCYLRCPSPSTESSSTDSRYRIFLMSPLLINRSEL